MLHAVIAPKRKTKLGRCRAKAYKREILFRHEGILFKAKSTQKTDVAVYGTPIFRAKKPLCPSESKLHRGAT